MIDPTEIIFTAISNDPKAYSSLKDWWDESLRDVHGYEVVQNKAERIQGIEDWFYIQAESIICRNSFINSIIDGLICTDDIDWEQLEYRLHEGAEEDD